MLLSEKLIVILITFAIGLIFLDWFGNTFTQSVKVTADEIRKV